MWSDNPANMARQIAEVLWEKLGDVPTNDHDEIEENFLAFEKGTHREEIWHWFEDMFNLRVATDLMYVGENTAKFQKLLERYDEQARNV